MSLPPYRGNGPALLRLPVEIRLQIYSCLLPRQRLFINLCELDIDPQPPPPGPLTGDMLHELKHEMRREPFTMSRLVARNLTVDRVSRTYGMQLVLVHHLLAAEVLDLLAKLVIRFHCPDCFGHWMDNVSFGLGVGISWLKHLEILYDVELKPRLFGPDLQITTPRIARFMMDKMLMWCQHTARIYFGRLDKYEPPREEWSYERFEDPPHNWRTHPNYGRRRPRHEMEAQFYAYDEGGLYLHPWVLQGGFPAPGMRPPLTSGYAPLSMWRLRRELSVVFPRREDDNEEERPYDPAHRTWIIKAEFTF